jgi:sugar/nucleoside kinase (ribokinase family)
LPRITVFSPNHVEALALCGRIPSPFTSDEQLERLLGDSLDDALKDAGTEFLRHMEVNRVNEGRSNRWERGVIIRCGSKGCLVFTAKEISHIPAYWTAQEQARVVDVTGGGNAFMGGLVAGLDLSDTSSLSEGRFAA